MNRDDRSVSANRSRLWYTVSKEEDLTLTAMTVAGQLSETIASKYVVSAWKFYKNWIIVIVKAQSLSEKYDKNWMEL